MELTLVPDRVPKVLVVSHERAGTHFLMNTIADNFGYVSDPWVDIDWPEVQNPYYAENFRRFLSQFQGRGVLNTFKCHFPAEFLKPIMPWMLEQFTIFHIFRQVYPLMDSLCRHIKAFPWAMGPDVPNGRELLTMEPSGALLRYQMDQKRNMLQRWQDHQAGWLTIEGVHHISYEALDERFDDEVMRIAGILDCSITKTVRPSRDKRVITSYEEDMQNVG
jgi:hypothetical protein